MCGFLWHIGILAYETYIRHAYKYCMNQGDKMHDNKQLLMKTNKLETNLRNI